jgi:cell division protein FtsQ
MAVLASRNRRRRADGGASPQLRGQLLLRGALAVAILLGLAWVASCLDGWAARSPRFALRTVRSHGLKRATEHELMRLASVGPGSNLWSLDTRAVAQAMASHPWVRSVDVTRSLPDTLDLRIEERTAAALASLGELYVVDSEGEPFKRLSAGEPLDLPLLSGISRESAVRDAAGTAARFREALAVVEAYERIARVPPLSEIHLQDAGFQLITSDGIRVVVGRAGIDEQLRRLGRVREELHQRGLLAAAIHLENRVRPGWVAVQVQPGAAAPRH